MSVWLALAVLALIGVIAGWVTLSDLFLIGLAVVIVFVFLHLGRGYVPRRRPPY